MSNNENGNDDDDEPEPGQVIAVREFSFKFGHLFKTNLSPFQNKSVTFSKQIFHLFKTNLSPFSEQYEVSQKLNGGILRSPVQELFLSGG